jgi:hypothetical protein
MHSRLRVIPLLALTACALAQSPATNAFEDAIKASAYDIHLDPATGRITGTAAPVLQQSIDTANFVFLGEQHITREIPQFAAAVCDIMAPRGLTGYVNEASPQAAALVQSLAASPDRIARMQDHLQRYPYSVAFLNIREENDLAAHCYTSAHNPHFTIWGVDQEFVGSSLWLIDRTLATAPGPKATAALKNLKSKIEAASITARASEHNSSKLLIESISDEEIESTSVLLAREGSPLAQSIFHELAESHSIYIKSLKGLPESNSQRALLLRHNLLAALDSAAAANPEKPPRFLIKLGGYHGYKGFNPLHQRDLGNMVAELADMRGQSSLHIMVLGVHGTERGYGGFGKPSTLHPYRLIDDPSNEWIKPFVDAQIPGGWTLYDLRKLRFGKQRPAGVEQQRLIDGYDLLVLIPEITPASMIEESVPNLKAGSTAPPR